MPFTFSHPAVVLPLKFFPKKWFSMTALIIGSMVPDFEYFIRMRIRSDFSHTLSGIFFFDLPLAILVMFIFHNIIRDSLINNMPIFLKSRFIKFTNFNWNAYFKQNWHIVIISCLIGIASHLAWDACTHKTGYFVRAFSVLQQDVSFAGYSAAVYKLLQHLSSFSGMAVICLFAAMMKREPVEKDDGSFKYWSMFIFLCLLISGIRFFAAADYISYGNMLVTAIAASFISFTLTPLLLKRKPFKRISEKKILVFPITAILLFSAFLFVRFNKNFLNLWDMNSVRVTVAKPLDKQKVKIEFGFNSISRANDLELFENNDRYITIYPQNEKPEFDHGENDFLLIYGDSYYLQFRQFKTNRRHQHSYKFHFYEKDGRICVKVRIAGINNINFEAPLINIKDASKYRNNRFIE